MLENILQDITDRVQSDALAAQRFFRLKSRPTAVWLRKLEAGVDAAQIVVNHTLATLPEGFAVRNLTEAERAKHAEEGVGPIQEPAIVRTETKPDGKEAEFELETPDAPPPTQPKPGGNLNELIGKLRGRVRVDADAGNEAVIAAVLQGAWARKAMMLTPLALPVLPWVHFAHMAHLRVQPWLGYYQETDTLIQRARNRCADAFLRSEAEWSWWVDGDIVPPWGDPAFFYDLKKLGIRQNRIAPEFLKVRALERLMGHGKTIVGAVYQQRRVAGAICSPLDLRPGGPDSKTEIKRLREHGPKDKLLEVEWAATGCLLVHRSVYEDIKRKFPDRAPKNEGEPWDFFGHDVSRMGEDAAFGLMAKQAGHQSYLDAGLWVAHVGNFAYMPEQLAT